MPLLNLYGVPFSQPVRTVIWLLLLKKQPFQLVPTNPGSKGETGSRHPTYLVKNPSGTIPCLEETDTGYTQEGLNTYLNTKGYLTEVVNQDIATGSIKPDRLSGQIPYSKLSLGAKEIPFSKIAVTGGELREVLGVGADALSIDVSITSKDIKDYELLIDVNYVNNLLIDRITRLNIKTIAGKDMLLYQALQNLDIWFDGKYSNKIDFKTLKQTIF